MACGRERLHEHVHRQNQVLTFASFSLGQDRVCDKDTQWMDVNAFWFYSPRRVQQEMSHLYLQTGRGQDAADTVSLDNQMNGNTKG